MTFVTIAVALLGSAMVLILGPVDGLVTYVALYMLYPPYLAVSLGTVSINAHRIVVVVLLCRVLLDHRSRAKSRWTVLDVLLVGSFAAMAVALSLRADLGIVMENRGGAFLDMIVPYVIARSVIHNQQDLVRLAKGLSLVVIPVAVLAVVESVAGWSPYAGLGQFSFLSGGAVGGEGPELRWGLNRAGGAVGGCISFGFCFVVLLPMMLLLVRQRGTWRTIGFIATGSAFAGTISSMSSGPLLGLVASSAAMALSVRPSLAKPALCLVLLAALAAEIGSNRHFYHLVGYVTFSSGTAWYRARLLEVAVGKLPEYWLLGYGFKDPGWGPELDMRGYTDVCNQYILMACRGGGLPVVLFVGALGHALARLRRVFRSGCGDVLKTASWYVGSMVVGMAVAITSAGLLGAEGLFYAMLGVVGSGAFSVVPGVQPRLPVVVCPRTSMAPGIHVYSQTADH